MTNVVDAYADRVVRRVIPAGKYHRLACVRHERDRGHEGTRRFPYRFDLPTAERFFRFAQSLKHYKGEWAGKPIVLGDYQKFRLGSVLGWLDTRTGLRRFRTSYHEIPRKNGKSLEAAVVALYLTFFDNEPGADGYCLATKKEQAKIVFNDAKRLVRHSGLKSRIKGSDQKHGSLYRLETDSKLDVLGADSESTDGLNPHVIINDEFHAQKNRGLLDVVETATGSRRQPQNFQITTAGNDPVSPCGDQHDYACKILDRVLTDDTFFAFIAHADPEDLAGDKWLSDATARKANPNYGISVRPDDLRALATKARYMTGAANAYKQKRLNVWVNTLAPWLSIEGWRKGQTTWAIESMRGQPCYIGIDLSSKIDLTAVVALFPPTADRKSWRLIAWCLTPEDTMAERALRDRAPYPQWVDAEFLRTNPGNRIDQSVVRSIVADAGAMFDIKGIGVDPWNAGNLQSELGDDGYEVIEVPQNYPQMSPPSKEFEADVLDGLVDAGGNPLVAWCASNAIAPSDGKDNIYPSKKRSRGRIDPIIAAVIARKLATADIGDAVAEDPVLVIM